MFKLIRRLITLGIIIAILLFSKNIIAKMAIQKGVQAATGLELKIGSIDLGVTKSHFGIKKLNLQNPRGFEDETMFSAPEVFVDYHLGDMVKGKVHLEEVRLDLDKLVVIKNEKGELNLDALKPKGDDSQAKGSETKKDAKKKGKAPDIQIDHMLLKVGKVIYKDYSGAEPLVKEFNVGINEELNDINSTEELMLIITQKALMKTALADMANFDIKFLQDVASQGTINQVKEKAGALTEKLFTFGGNKE